MEIRFGELPRNVEHQRVVLAVCVTRVVRISEEKSRFGRSKTEMSPSTLKGEGISFETGRFAKKCYDSHAHISQQHSLISEIYAT